MQELDQFTIDSAKHNNRAAFKRIYDYYAPFVWKIAFRTMHSNHEKATEVVQDTFIRVHKSLDQFHHDCAFSTWLYRITYNNCMTLYEKNRNMNNTLEFNEETFSGGVLSSTLELKEAINAILKSLSAEDRFLLTGREILDLSYDELAEITKKNAGLLRTRLSRLKDDIRKRFGDSYGKD